MTPTYRRFQSSYRRQPTTLLEQPFFVFTAMPTLVNTLLRHQSPIIALDVYPSVQVDALVDAFVKIANPFVIKLEDFYTPKAQLEPTIQGYLTTDRVFGKMNPLRLKDYLTGQAIEDINTLIKDKPLVLIVGLGASLIAKHSLKVMVDCPRWELQLQYRKGGSNFYHHNPEEDTLKKYKRGFFLDWVIGDDHKFSQFETFDYFIDLVNPDHPTMINQASMQQVITCLSQQPFRLVPYFDPGVWGGQWMKVVCDLPEGPPNYAWAFDGVPEENALRVSDGKSVFTMPAQNLVYKGKQALLGDHVYQRFGSHFPIRFDFLDTMQGQHLSLQVHPTMAYIKQQFGMPFTQDESYYILDAGDEAVVYLGVKEKIDQEKFWQLLADANAGKIKEPNLDAYVNRYPVKRHDHVSIPSGTIHCSGKNTMVLEISATPFIFTFKLWDWGRLGLDGLPRPVHLDHGKANLDFKKDTPFVEKELLFKPQPLNQHEERTGLHHTEFIETRRFTLKDNQPILVTTHQSVNMANVVEGEGLIVLPVDGQFAPFEVHYAETFIIPASVNTFYIKRIGNHPVMMIQAYVREL